VPEFRPPLLAPLLTRRFWRGKLAQWQSRAFDRRHGTDTAAQVPLTAMPDVAAELAAHAVHYEATAMPKLKRALGFLRAHLGDALPGYSFVDVGSGKGLVVMLASLLPFREVCGVEMSPGLHAIAQSNVRKFRSRHPGAAPIELRCGDALCARLPAGNCVVYLYHPFDAHMIARLLERLGEAGASGSGLVVVYVNPVHRELFDRQRRWRRVFDDGSLCAWAFDAAAGRAEGRA
jgi:SAM-dependent methyltransferase